MADFRGGGGGGGQKGPKKPILNRVKAFIKTFEAPQRSVKIKLLS